MTSPIKVAVTGAAGQIGYSLVFRIASGAMFGPDQPIAMSLIEIPNALGALEGVVMELHDCAFPLLKSITPTADLDEGFREVNWALLVGSVPRKAGMERKDLLGINGKIFIGQGQAIEKNASADVRILVIGNPCNTNCLIAMYNAKINGRSANEVIRDEAWLKGNFITSVQQRGAAIIKARGLSSAASAANAVVDTVRSLITDTPKEDWHSVALRSTGEYGVENGLICSFPVRVKDGKPEVVQNVPVNEFSRGKIDASVNELKEERSLVGDLLRA